MPRVMLSGHDIYIFLDYFHISDKTLSSVTAFIHLCKKPVFEDPISASENVNAGAITHVPSVLVVC